MEYSHFPVVTVATVFVVSVDTLPLEEEDESVGAFVCDVSEVVVAPMVTVGVALATVLEVSRTKYGV